LSSPFLVSILASYFMWIIICDAFCCILGLNCAIRQLYRARKQLKTKTVIDLPRSHDQANIEQSSSKHPADVFKMHVHDMCSNCSMFPRRLLDVCLMIA